MERSASGDGARPGAAGPARATGAQSIERALSVLSAFIQTRPALGVAEVARAVGLSPSTTHRILRALVAGGYLTQSDTTNRYALGRSALLLGQVAERNLGLDLARPVLERLGADTGESVNLGVREGRTAVVALRVLSAQPLRLDQPPGTRVALDCSAMGKALLAFSSDPAREVAALAPFEARTARTLVDPAALERDVVLTRERGWSVDDEESMVGVRCIGAPVLDAGGLARAAIAVQAPAARMPRSRFATLAPSVVAAALEIAETMPAGRALGGNAPAPPLAA